MPALTPADEAKLRALAARHNALRARLPADHRSLLDKLTSLVQRRLFATLPQHDLIGAGARIVQAMLPTLSWREATDLTAYALAGIAATTTLPPAGAPSVRTLSSSLRDLLPSFSLQFVLLQNVMQDESRLFTDISNI